MLQSLRKFMLFFLIVLITAGASAQPDPLPSWKDGATKKAITDFVTRVSRDGNPDFVPVDERIATFDNDGTLWNEQPIYVELAFTFQQIVKMAPQHPDWQTRQPFAAVLHHDNKALAASGEAGIIKLFIATHAGMTTDEFTRIISDWLATAEHPKFHRLYTQCVYQPMLELMAYLRANGFKTYIVSGGEQEFMRPFSEKVYGVPPEQVIGTQFKSQYKINAGTPEINRLSEVLSIDDGPGKPENIQRFIGRKPIAAFGNSDGDIQMLEWTASSSRSNLEVLVHHTDAAREYAYDVNASMGRLDQGLTEAVKKKWIVVDMKTDWKTIFPSSTP